MKSWTLIPFYLWKNTCRRWLEYPVSPCSKLLIPALLAVLAMIVLTLFGEVERELRQQLERASVYSVYVSEFVPGDNAATILRKTYQDEIMWTRRYGAESFKDLRQPLVSALWKQNQALPMYAFTSSVTDFDGDVDPDLPPVMWVLSDAADPQRLAEIKISGKRVLAKVHRVPDWIRKGMAVPEAVMAPVEMIEPILNNGFVNHMVANFSSVDEVQQFVNEVSAYYRADKRQVKIVSALEILKNLERITSIQRIVRTMIVMGCGVILALTLGSIAWLEYRQDSYLLALLRSFGTPSAVLLVHMLFENLLLVFVGVALARSAWTPLFRLAAPQLHSIGLQAPGVPTLPVGDVAIIFLAGGVGVVLAMIPVAFGLRKPAGLILQ